MGFFAPLTLYLKGTENKGVCVWIVKFLFNWHVLLLDLILEIYKAYSCDFYICLLSSYQIVYLAWF